MKNYHIIALNQHDNYSITVNIYQTWNTPWIKLWKNASIMHNFINELRFFWRSINKTYSHKQLVYFYIDSIHDIDILHRDCKCGEPLVIHFHPDGKVTNCKFIEIDPTWELICEDCAKKLTQLPVWEVKE